MMENTKISAEVVSDLNRIIKFLAKRDISSIEQRALKDSFNIEKVDLIILLGNSITYTLNVASYAFKNGIADKLMIVGGIGHSTSYLVANVYNNPLYKDTETSGLPEADIFKSILIRHLGMLEKDIIIENKSTNCGSNAVEALRVLKENNMYPKSIILTQDPTMQLRSHASFTKVWNSEKNVQFISYAPFIPLLELRDNNLYFSDNSIDGIWDLDRFLSLLLGEIPRLNDSKDGYGPNGKGFISHVDIPDDIFTAYENVTQIFSKFCNR